MAEHTYEEVPGPVRMQLPPSHYDYEMQPPHNPQYDAPRRLYYNQYPDSSEVVDQFIDTSDEYHAFTDQDHLTVQPPVATGQEQPVPKPRTKSTSPRDDLLPAAPLIHSSEDSPRPISPYTVMHSEDVVRWQIERDAGRTDGDDDLPPPLSATTNTLLTASGGSAGSQTGGYVTINRQQMIASGEMAQLQGEGGSVHSGDPTHGIGQLRVSDQQGVIPPVESCYSDQLFGGGERPMHPRQTGSPASHSSASSQGPTSSQKHQELEGSGALSYANAGPSSSKANEQVSRYCKCMPGGFPAYLRV